MSNSNNDLPLTNIKASILEDTDFSDISGRKKRNILNTVSDSFGEFSRNTSIHGFKYLSASRGCTFEKIWWLTILGSCIYLCTTLTIKTLKKREENPVFISFGQAPMHIWDIPFPAITICSAARIKPNKYNLSDYTDRCIRNNLTAEELQFFMNINMFCETSKEYCSLPTSKHKPDHKSIDYFIEQISSLSDILASCTMNEKEYPCVDHFSPFLTYSGLCFSFNMLDRSDLYQNITYLPAKHAKQKKILHWSVDNNYIKTLNSTFPLRFTKFTDALYLRLKVSHSDEVCGKYSGFRVILHHPAETPSLANRYLLLSNDVNYKAWIKPHVTTTSSNLEDYYPHKRGCFFSTERKLKYYKIYTEQNCNMECISNLTIQRCGCGLYHAPHEITTRLCSLADKNCVIGVKEEFLSMEMKLDLFEDDNQSHKYRKKSCDCLPSCTSIEYNAEVSPEHTSETSENGTSYTSIHLTFKDVNFETMERKELFSNADFWASCGGLLGLFTGFSVVSLAEIIYFATMRWMCNIWNMQKRIWC